MLTCPMSPLRLRPPNATASPSQLYTADVDAVIQRRLPSLKAIFDVLVARGKSTTRRQKLLGVVDWLAFLKAANITGPDASERDATLWSVTWIVD